jgi:hypothetical protein
MGEIYLSNELIPSARKRKILELIEHGPSKGEISVTLHQAAHLAGNDLEHVEPSWTYDYGTDPRQIEVVVETVDRLIAVLDMLNEVSDPVPSSCLQPLACLFDLALQHCDPLAF